MLGVACAAALMLVFANQQESTLAKHNCKASYATSAEHLRKATLTTLAKHNCKASECFE
ncbi:hypothetical protein CGSMWGv00703Dmash_05324 [Gardnerella greenwoodii 00703Dmash]|uniref:Uncharacterized protein n=1 Tax=Gardnerella greenwoodii 00703Dmash TaxID=698960 RepID=I4M8C2_9BIFI|nr:hypothetical protein CGSMWGv00703Dmash_05324 [Gardnerella greenwoodii 00703Dmash]